MKIFLSDLDGTLLFDKHDIHDNDIDAIKRLHQTGIRFGIATGRDYGFCKKLMERYQLPVEIMILNNGGSLIVNEERVMEKIFTTQEVETIMRFIQPYVGDLHPFICDEKSHFYMMKNAYTKDGWKKIRDELGYLGVIHDIDLLQALQQMDTPIIKLTICIKEAYLTKKYLTLLQERFADFEVLMTAPDYIEFTKKGVHKGSALLKLEEFLSISRDDVYFIGDGENDLSLMELSGFSFAMKDAPENVKNTANVIVTSVAEAIKTIL